MKTHQRKHLQKLFLPGMLLTFMLAFLFTSKASASGLTQVNPALDSITVQWAAPTGRNVTGYTVYVGTSYADRAQFATLPGNATSVTVPGLPAGCERYIRVEYTYTSSSGRSYNDSIGYDDFKTAPGKVTNVHQAQWWYFIKSFDVEWDEQPAADGYEYVICNSKNKALANATTPSERASLNKVSNSMVYNTRVRAYADICGQRLYGDWSDLCYCFTQPRLKSLKLSGSTLTVKWGKVNGATGYDIYVSTKPKTGYKKVKSVGKKASSATITKIKGKKLNKKKYYVYIVTKKNVNGQLSTSGRLYYWNTKNKSYGYF